MLVMVHAQLIRQALAGEVSPRALEAILAANLAQDGLRYQVGHDEFHFDNNAIDKGRAYMETQRGLIPPALARGDVAAAWQAFGRLTHTAQDFYAHTSYVSLWLARHGETSEAAQAEIDPMEQALLESPELRSGRLYYPAELLYFIAAFRKFALSILPADSHAHMNLDSQEQGWRFDYAFQAALKRTRIELEHLESMLGPGLFSLFCDL
jgi:hypothetical protein